MRCRWDESQEAVGVTPPAPTPKHHSGARVNIEVSTGPGLQLGLVAGKWHWQSAIVDPKASAPGIMKAAYSINFLSM